MLQNLHLGTRLERYLEKCTIIRKWPSEWDRSPCDHVYCPPICRRVTHFIPFSMHLPVPCDILITHIAIPNHKEGIGESVQSLSKCKPLFWHQSWQWTLKNIPACVGHIYLYVQLNQKRKEHIIQVLWLTTLYHNYNVNSSYISIYSISIFLVHLSGTYIYMQFRHNASPTASYDWARTV